MKLFTDVVYVCQGRPTLHLCFVLYLLTCEFVRAHDQKACFLAIFSVTTWERLLVLVRGHTNILYKYYIMTKHMVKGIDNAFESIPFDHMELFCRISRTIISEKNSLPFQKISFITDSHVAMFCYPHF